MKSAIRILAAFIILVASFAIALPSITLLPAPIASASDNATFYPDAPGIDGQTRRRYNGDETWAQLIAGVGTEVYIDMTYIREPGYTTSATTNKWVVSYRAILTYPASLPSGYVIESGNISLLGFGKLDDTSSTPDINIYPFFGLDTPVKYGSNPILEGGTWDSDIHYQTVLTNPNWPAASRYRIWYSGVDVGIHVSSCYAYSSDGLSWTKPNLGLYTYDGNTNNNIFLPIGLYIGGAYYDEDSGTYIMVVGGDFNKTPINRIDIYTSSSPDSGFTCVKELYVDPAYYGPSNGNHIVKNADGKWIVYYQMGNALGLRKIGAYLSNTTAIGGDYTDQGVVIDGGASANNQRYWVQVQKPYEGLYYGWVVNYSNATDLTWIGYWVSENGLSWKEVKNNWIVNGAGGTWDDGQLTAGSFVRVGNELWYYYSGADEPHSTLPKDSSIGLAKLSIYKTSILPEDYRAYGVTPFSTAITYAEWNVAGWNVFTLNADALAAIKSMIDWIGLCKFSILNANHDVAASAPNWVISKTSYLDFYSSEQGAGFKPELRLFFTEELGAPTNVSATDGTHTDKVVITWTKVSGATAYEVFRGSVGLGELGDVATFDDTGAGAPTITPGSTVASDGAFTEGVSLSLSGSSANNGTTHSYTVKAKNGGVWSEASAADNGYRGVGALTYQWQRSSGDSNADYSNIGGATSSTHYDTDAPAGIITPGTASASDGTSIYHVTLSIAGESVSEGAGRYYKCVLNATGASQQTSGPNRGYRGVGALTYQWQRSATDNNSDFSVLTGATTDPFNDTTAPPGDTEGRWYYCAVSAVGAITQDTDHNRGYRGYTPGKYLVIYVDGVEKGVAFMGDVEVPESTANWTFCTGNTTMYIGSIEYDAGGLPVSAWEWEYGATFHDSIGSNDATPTFRTASSDEDVSASLVSFFPVSESKVTTFTLAGELPTLLPPAAVTGMYTEEDYEHILGAEAVNEMLGKAGVPKSLWWFPFVYFSICIIGFIVYGATQGPMGKNSQSNPLDGSLLTMAIVMEVLIVVAGIMNPVPLWPAYLFPIPAMALITSRKHYSLG